MVRDTGFEPVTPTVSRSEHSMTQWLTAYFGLQAKRTLPPLFQSDRTHSTALARLMERAPWSEVITKTTKREGPTRSERVYYCFNPAALREVETVDDINEFFESGGVEV